MILESIFKCCGDIVKWKRVVDQYGKPKGNFELSVAFGFVEFRTADGAGRAVRLLHDYPLFGKNLIVKASKDTMDHIKRYETEVSNYLGQPVDLTDEDQQVMEEIHLAVISAQEQLKKQQDIKELLDFSHVFERKGSVNRKKSAIEEEEEENERKREERRKREQEQAFREREKRWENREIQNEKTRRKEQERESERLRFLSKEKERMMKMLQEYDDDKAQDDFTIDRERWKLKRAKEVERERENDEKDRQKEAAELAPKSPLENNNSNPIEFSTIEEEAPPIPEEFIESIPTAPTVPTQSYEAYNPNGNIKVGFTASSTNAKKARPTAAEAFQDDPALQSSTTTDMPDMQVKKKKPLLPLQFTREELLAEGYTPHEIEKKLKEDEQLRVQRIIENIPTNRHELFSYRVEWDAVDYELLEGPLRSWISKKVSEYVGMEEKSLVNFVVDRIAKKCRPSDLVNELKAALENDAETFVMKVWRSLIFESENKLASARSK